MIVKQSVFLKRAAKNNRVRSIFRLIESGTFALDTDKFIKEMEQLHTLSKARTLRPRDILKKFQRTAVPAVIQNQAHRSRCVAIKTQCYSVSTQLERHLEVLRKYLGHKYNNLLIREGRTIGERNHLIDVLLEPAIQLINDANKVIELADIFIDDYDKTAWSLKSLVDIMATSNKRSWEL